MHYKNGREAHNGETVVGKSQYAVSPVVGIIQDINPGSTSCNCMVIRPGGLIQSCVTVGDLYHVDDVVAAIETLTANLAKDATPLPADGTSAPQPANDTSAASQPT